VPLSPDEAIEQARLLLEMRDKEKDRLDRIHEYLRSDELSGGGRRSRAMHWLPNDTPEDLLRLAVISRVNVLKFVVNARVQAMYVDGYRGAREADDAPAWEIWQRNRFDARQIGVHRAALSFGAAYVTVLPGDPVPVMRGASPRMMTVAYGDDDDWPELALERRRGKRLRLLDAEAVYTLAHDADDSDRILHVRTDLHDAGVTPVVRYRETDDLDAEVTGIVEGLIPLQDQINVTTFGLQVAQHFGAFRQRYIIGWLAESEEQKLKASASKLWTFEDSPSDISIDEFEQTDLKGYIDSREATLRHLSTISQTPAHELLGQLVNLSAEALAAAEAAHRRAVTENETVIGESHEQSLNLAGRLLGIEEVPDAEVRWRDTESRSLAATVDALGKLTQMLGVPPQELWEKIPGATQQEVERWRAAAAEGDAFANLTNLLERQAGPAEADVEAA
jgi:hypothetical protein